MNFLSSASATKDNESRESHMGEEGISSKDQGWRVNRDFI